MGAPLDPTATAFLLAENRSMPMHVGALQLFEPPADAGPSWAADLVERLRATEQVAPLFLKHPRRSLATAGQWTWATDSQFDVEHHVRHSALPQPGRIRELLELCGRLHGTRLAYERPLWEWHLIEGLADGRFAMYSKMHHALLDGVAAMRLLQAVLSEDPDERDMPAPWALRTDAGRGGRPGHGGHNGQHGHHGHGLAEAGHALRSALGIAGEAAGLPGSLVRTLNRGLRNQTSAVSFYSPRTLLNRPITGARRFAAQDWPLDRLRAIGRASGTTLNDVVLAMCSGALRSYLLDLHALPEATLTAMVPVSFKRGEASTASAAGGNAVGAVMVRLGTDRADAADRLAAVHTSMVEGKEALDSMTNAQALAMSALGLAPAVALPLLRLQGVTRPPFNLIISNVPGPEGTRFFDGAPMVGMYPLSIPLHGIALNITCTSYDGRLGFGLTGCRRTVPRLQRLLTYLDEEVAALESAVGVA
ncbi:wax ester/triacylglycerol synthase family O-acyltransferase [Nocardioides sp. ChNu-153]|uniref:WS/DGAT/MGAT family O-acyltransferase n=1 Tax=unclassified Nocardioides TaxID=2615069 RepID=UPI0024049A07|nr:MULTISPECIES: wax ester/triacylglycerol synthase family O-acyltransferase [unclassified Nocardioides]MDF9717553.1 wax ester/triacylglycerol synthase family O-acyltransferase [Nocardioides sp. ChNu-99]MDN7123140.1 wax ester/triacylglycerol synthase family O-acyltransferase [Nocardioides sp. ChNu-153]